MQQAHGMVDFLTTQVRGANFTSSDSLRKNARACVINAMAEVSPTPSVEAAALKAMNATLSFAARLTMFNPAEAERREALSALEDFRSELENAKPSSLANALRL